MRGENPAGPGEPVGPATAGLRPPVEVCQGDGAAGGSRRVPGRREAPVELLLSCSAEEQWGKRKEVSGADSPTKNGVSLFGLSQPVRWRGPEEGLQRNMARAQPRCFWIIPNPLETLRGAGERLEKGRP